MGPELISGRYRVKRAIGRGGMGTVWLCTDELLGRDVAVKQVGLLPDESAPDSARALREARSSATLNHRNVVSVFDVVETDGSIWMVMEYVPSRTLGQVIREDGPLPPEQVAGIGAQVADGLAAAHAAGTIHRDVKPDNILLTEEGIAKIGDFGIARMHGDQPLTQAGFLTGTPSYFSPELAQGQDPAPAADVWALGATLYAAVEGNPPYPPQANPMAMLRTIASGPPARPRRAGFLEPALTRMLDRDPGSRWSMSDAAHALHRLADQHGADEDTLRNTAAFAAPAGLAEPEPRAAAAPQPSARAARRQPVAAAPTPTMTPRNAPGRPGPPPSLGPLREDRPRRRRGLLLPLAAMLLLLLAAGGGYALLNGGDENRRASQVADASQTTSHSPRRSNTTSPSPSTQSSRNLEPSRTPEPSNTPEPSSTPEPSNTSIARKPAGSPVGFIERYYATAPQDQQAGWSMVGPGIRQLGRSSYDDFWGSIDSVGVSSVQPSADGSSADVTLTYHFSDGRITVERQTLQLIRSSGGGYLINGQKVLSSRTVSE
jgi:eukaryotic-like serine/threonine-protein kinase